MLPKSNLAAEKVQVSVSTSFDEIEGSLTCFLKCWQDA